MRSLLMFPDRDFDPRQLLISNVMYRYREIDRQSRLSPHDRSLVEDLELNTFLNAMAGGDEFLFEVAQAVLLTGQGNNVETVLYRQDVLSDCLEERATVRQLYGLAAEVTEGTRRKWFDLSSNTPSSLIYYASDLLEVLLSVLRRLRSLAEQQAGKFKSKAFTALFATFRDEIGDEYLAHVQKHLTELRFRKGVLLSAKLGDSNQSTNLVLRTPPDKRRHWYERVLRNGPASYSFRLAERDEAGGRILSDMRNRGIARVAVALAQSADHVLGFFRTLRTELAFYVGCLNLHDQLVTMGAPVCFPTPAPAGRRAHSFNRLYDVSLRLQLEGKVVGNTVDAVGKGLVIITGANQGGKSSFLRSIGQAQLMMQCGMFVGAESFKSEMCTGLFTHYKREEDVTMKSGKFDEEVARMSDIVDRIAPNSLLLFNESFAATNEREGSEIANQIVRALLEKSIKIFYVTHLYDFAHRLYEGKIENALFLRAESLGGHPKAANGGHLKTGQ